MCTLELTLHDILGETLLLWNLLGNILVYSLPHKECCRPIQSKVKVIVYEKSRLNSAHLFCWLVRDFVHHLAALLPRDGGALLPRYRLALLLVNIACLHHRLVLAHLPGNLATVLTRLLDIITNLQTNQGHENLLNNGSIYLLRELVADQVVGDGELAVCDEAGFGPGHEGAEWRGTVRPCCLGTWTHQGLVTGPHSSLVTTSVSHRWVSTVSDSWRGTWPQLSLSTSSYCDCDTPGWASHGTSRNNRWFRLRHAATFILVHGGALLARNILIRKVRTAF